MLPLTWATPQLREHSHTALSAVAPFAARLRPQQDLIFKAFEMVPPAAVRVVLLGQDPYPTPGHAQGLSFSVPHGTQPLPPTLRNILKELESDLGASRSPDLTAWAKQGVLLANAALTMAGGKTGEHLAHWEAFTRGWVQHVLSLEQPYVWVLWGNDAKAFKPLITGANQRIIESSHPSPLSAYRDFWGSKPFSRTNALLIELGQQPIDWLAA